MSDAGRKGVLDQATEKITPDSQKSTLDQAKEGVTGAYDRAAGSIQPGDQKSTTQKASDNIRSGSDDASNESKGIMANAQEAIGNAAQTVSDTLTGGAKK